MWLSNRFSETCTLVARVAAQLTHIDQTMEILKSFIDAKKVKNPNVDVSYERYCQLKDFVESRCRSSNNTIVIKSNFHVLMCPDEAWLGKFSEKKEGIPQFSINQTLNKLEQFFYIL